MQYIADVPPHPTLSIFHLTFPTTHATIIDKFRKHIKHIPRKNGQKIVAVIDSIVSNPGVKLPWREMVKVCKEFGIWSVIDGAHSIGQELDLNLKDADPDFWVSVNNMHYFTYFIAHIFASELSQVAVLQKRLCHFICSKEVCCYLFDTT